MEMVPPATIARERDEIYSLLAYAIVLENWQISDREGRGYNVGCILVDADANILGHGLNAVNSYENCTQHGEVRLITEYLNTPGVYALTDHEIYSTLEPCAMCAGMMTIAAVRRVINGQNDYYFSKALERLSFDSVACGGYPPYPRSVISEMTPSVFGSELDAAYSHYIELGNRPIITKFLATDAARDIFAAASKSLTEFQCTFQENHSILHNAHRYLDKVRGKP